MNYTHNLRNQNKEISIEELCSATWLYVKSHSSLNKLEFFKDLKGKEYLFIALAKIALSIKNLKNEPDNAIVPSFKLLINAKKISNKLKILRKRKLKQN